MKWDEGEVQHLAFQVLESYAASIDYMGVGEILEDEWDDLSEEEFEQLQKEVYEKAKSARIWAVRWDD